MSKYFSLWQNIPERQQKNYEKVPQSNTAAIMFVLKNAAAGDDPEVAARKARELYLAKSEKDS